MADPVSFRDPAYDALDGATTAKLGLPDGLLASIRLNGEKSNADQVSSAGAATAYQIIPSTRKAAIDKYGIDPYLSAANASEVAGLLLKDSLDRNGGDPALAAAEYHGGTDRANWGPKTMAYVQRVAGALPAAAPVPAVGQSTFDRVSAQMSQPDPSALTNVANAYQAGHLSPEDTSRFEQEVTAGHIMLPQGMTLKKPAENPSVPGTPAAAVPGVPVPNSILEAYVSGTLSPSDEREFEQHVKAGSLVLPAGITLGNTNKPTDPGFFANLKEAFTGTQRRTAETDALPDYVNMPEFSSGTGSTLKTALGTMTGGPGEIAQVIAANNPDVQVRTDAKGNYILRSAVDGQEYAIKPGFQVSDIPRALGVGAAFSPAGAARTIVGGALGSAATQGAIEASRAATGGQANVGDIATAGALGAAVPIVGRAVGAAADVGQAALARVRGAPIPEISPAAAVREAATPEVPLAPQPAPAAPVTPAAPAVPMASEQLAQTAKTAAEGNTSATQAFADQLAPDPKTLAAAKRLGIEDYLQPDHLTNSQSVREVLQAVKSQPGSEAHAAEIAGLEKTMQRASDVIDEIGGTNDLSTLDKKVKATLNETADDLQAKSDFHYQMVRDAIPPKTEATPTNTLAFLEQHADELGGANRLLPPEKKLLNALNGDDGPVTYAYLDQTRKQVGQALRKATGPFADSESGILNKLYGNLSTDQEAVAKAHGVDFDFAAAKAAVQGRKKIEDDLTSLFGKALDSSLVGSLPGAVRALPQGNVSGLVRLLGAVPEGMRQEVMASGLSTAFRTAATRGPINFGTYAKFYEGLLANKQAHALVMTNLPPQARKQLSDLYRVSKAVSASTRERITTGRIQAMKEQFSDPDTLAGNLYAHARRNTIGVVAGTVLGHIPIVGPGIGAAVTSALTKGAKPAAIKAVDQLLVSPQFQRAMVQAQAGDSKGAAAALAHSIPFARYVRAMGFPQDMSNKERWILQAMQANNQGRQ